MCGIAGVFEFGAAPSSVDEGVLQRMKQALSHRGPDDQGIHVSPDRRCGLAHTRLSILDTSANGRQPMSNEDGSLWITYNGEVYNSPELRPDLLSRGHQFRSRTDTEVIVHSFEDQGISCVRGMEGMFAFGLYSEKERKLYLCRDRLGQKPLYYYVGPHSLVFASEIKALLQHPDVPRDLDMEALGHYLSFRTTVPPLTMYRGIRKLEAATYLSCDESGHIDQRRYWDPFDPALGPAFDVGDVTRSAREVRRLLSESVRKLLLSDVPLGAFLSGGLDSSAIVGLMAEHTTGSIDTFTVVWRDHEEFNEGDFPRLVSERFHTNNHEIVLDERALSGYLQELVHAQDEPMADSVSVPLHYLAEQTRRQGIKVVLVGEGSDEIFLGYDSRVDAIDSFEHRWRALYGLPLILRKGLFAGVEWAGDRAKGLGSRVPDGVREKLRRLAQDDELFYGSVAFSDARKEKLLSEHARASGQVRDAQSVLKGYAGRLLDLRPGAGFADKVINLDLKLRLAELLLPRVDRMTMASGIEARAPFLEHALVELAVRIPVAQKIVGGQGKHVLKQALSDLLPASILNRPKKPFGVPMGPWLRTGLSDFARHTILHSRLRERGLFDYAFIEDVLAAHKAGATEREVEIFSLMTLSAWYDRWLA